MVLIKKLSGGHYHIRQSAEQWVQAPYLPETEDELRQYQFHELSQDFITSALTAVKRYIEKAGVSWDEIKEMTV